MSPRLLLASLLFSLIALFIPTHQTHAQCNQKLSELPDAPELLGFRMGMTKEEVKAKVPQVAFGRKDDFGVTKTTINPYFDSRIDKTKFESVRSISLDMLDEKLTSIWIGFDETYKVQALDEFTKSVSQSLKVSANWSNWKSRGQQLRCSDFQLIASTVAGGPTLRIVDIAAEDLIATRRQEKEERDSALENGTAEEETSQVVGNRQTKTYYLSTCQVPEIAETNKVVFKTVEEAEKAGYKVAKDCH
jgi:hypothetical protein